MSYLCDDHLKNGVPVQIRYRYNRPIAGMRERGFGIPLEPDIPAHVEILSIRSLKTKQSIDADQDEIERICEHLLDTHNW